MVAVGFSSGTGTGSGSFAVPVGTVDGDLLVAAVWSIATSAPTISGWTNVSSSGSSMGATCDRRIASSTTTVPVTASGEWIGVCCRIPSFTFDSGVGSGAATGATSYADTGLTNSGAGIDLHFYGQNKGATSSVDISVGSLTLTGAFHTSDTMAAAVGYEEHYSAGTVAAKTATGDSGTWKGFHVALLGTVTPPPARRRTPVTVARSLFASSGLR